MTEWMREAEKSQKQHKRIVMIWVRAVERELKSQKLEMGDREIKLFSSCGGGYWARLVEKPKKRAWERSKRLLEKRRVDILSRVIMQLQWLRSQNTRGEYAINLNRAHKYTLDAIRDQEVTAYRSFEAKRLRGRPSNLSQNISLTLMCSLCVKYMRGPAGRNFDLNAASLLIFEICGKVREMGDDQKIPILSAKRIRNIYHETMFRLPELAKLRAKKVKELKEKQGDSFWGKLNLSGVYSEDFLLEELEKVTFGR